MASAASTIALEAAVAVADDAPVGARVGRLEREHGRRRAGRAVGVDERLEQLRRHARVVAGDDEQRRPRRQPARCGAERVAGAERLLLHRDLDVLDGVRGLRRRDDDERIGPERAHRLDHPVDEPTAEQRMEVLRRRGPHPRAEARGHHDCCEFAGHQSWGARIRTWDRGTKTRCLTTWLRPTATIDPVSQGNANAAGRRPRRQSRPGLDGRCCKQQLRTWLRPTAVAAGSLGAPVVLKQVDKGGDREQSDENERDGRQDEREEDDEDRERPAPTPR